MGILLAAILILFYWYFEAGSISDQDVPGKYSFSNAGTVATLAVAKNHTFHQVLRNNTNSLVADGTWHISGQGHIGFSKEFLLLPGQEPCYEKPACGHVENYFGIMRIEMGLNRPGLLFKKRLF